MVCLPDNLTVRLEGATEGIKDSSFAFDKVFGPQSSQADVFAEVSDLVQSALDGYKVGYATLCCSQHCASNVRSTIKACASFGQNWSLGANQGSAVCVIRPHWLTLGWFRPAYMLRHCI